MGVGDTMTHTYRTEGKLWVSFLCVHDVGSEDQTQLIMLGCKCPYWLKHLTCPGELSC